MAYISVSLLLSQTCYYSGHSIAGIQASATQDADNFCLIVFPFINLNLSLLKKVRLKLLQDMF